MLFMLPEAMCVPYYQQSAVNTVHLNFAIDCVCWLVHINHELSHMLLCIVRNDFLYTS